MTVKRNVHSTYRGVNLKHFANNLVLLRADTDKFENDSLGVLDLRRT